MRKMKEIRVSYVLGILAISVGGRSLLRRRVDCKLLFLIKVLEVENWEIHLL